MFCHYAIIVASFLCMETSVGFNIILNENLQNRIHDNSSSLSTQYFGQRIQFQSNESLLVSVPYLSHSASKVGNSTGGISSCPVHLNTKLHSKCSDITPTAPKLVAGDAFGLDFEVDPHGNVTACSPLRSMICRGNVLKLGYCYSGTGHGTEWSPLSLLDGFGQECPQDQIDLVFVLDGSTSINELDPNNFNTVKNWVKNITKQFDISASGSAAVGVIQYSTYLPFLQLDKIITEIELGQYTSFSEFSSALDKVSLQNGATYTAAALSRAAGVFMNSTRFNDTLTKKVLVLLTDGQSNDRSDLAANSAFIRSLNITTIAVGVKADVLQELQIIANGEVGNNNRVYELSDFANLDSIVQSIFQQIERISLEGSSSSSFSSEGNGLRFSETGFSKSYGTITL